MPAVSPDKGLAIRRLGVAGFIEVRTAMNFADLKADADYIASCLNRSLEPDATRRVDGDLTRTAPKPILELKQLPEPFRG